MGSQFNKQVLEDQIKNILKQNSALASHRITLIEINVLKNILIMKILTSPTYFNFKRTSEYL